MSVLYRHWEWALPKDVGGRARRPWHLDPQEWSRRRLPDQGEPAGALGGKLGPAALAVLGRLLFGADLDLNPVRVVVGVGERRVDLGPHEARLVLEDLLRAQTPALASSAPRLALSSAMIRLARSLPSWLAAAHRLCGPVVALNDTSFPGQTPRYEHETEAVSEALEWSARLRSNRAVSDAKEPRIMKLVFR